MTLIDKERRLRLRVLEARRHVRPYDAGRRAPPLPRVRQARRALGAGDDHVDRPEARRVTTDAGTHEADVLVVALGADYDMDATPGLAESGDEFYSFAGASGMRDADPGFSRGRVVDRRVRRAVQVPARAERVRADAARLPRRARRPRRLRDHPRAAVRDARCLPRPRRRRRWSTAFAERGIASSPAARSPRSTSARRVVVLDDGGELPYDLFLGVPKHRAPESWSASGMTENGYVPVDSATLETRFAGVYAIGDVATQGTPKAGVFAEGAARALATSLIAQLRGGGAGRRPLRHRLLLHRVRGRPDRPRRHRLPLRARRRPGHTRRRRRPARREAALRREPPRPLVRPHVLTPAPV